MLAWTAANTEQTSRKKTSTRERFAIENAVWFSEMFIKSDYTNGLSTKNRKSGALTFVATTEHSDNYSHHDHVMNQVPLSYLKCM